MVKVKLADWCDRWYYDDFTIARGQEKDTTDDILALSMGRLVKIEATHEKASKK